MPLFTFGRSSQGGIGYTICGLGTADDKREIVIAELTELQDKLIDLLNNVEN